MGKKNTQTTPKTGDDVRDKENLGFKIKVKCKTPAQKSLLKSIREKEVTFITGPAGSGKSYISIYAALELLKDPENNYKKIILIYPVEVDKTESVGFLKGTLEEKLAPYYEADFYTMEKIFNASGVNGKNVLKGLVDSGLIEIKTAAFLRGSTIDDAVVIVSEAQNFTKTTFIKILTRIGTSKYIFNADEYQLDADSIKGGNKEAGLRYAIDKLGGLEEIGVVEFGMGDICRNPLITKILSRWSPELYGDKGEEKD